MFKMTPAGAVLVFSLICGGANGEETRKMRIAHCDAEIRTAITDGFLAMANREASLQRILSKLEYGWLKDHGELPARIAEAKQEGPDFQKRTDVCFVFGLWYLRDQRAQKMAKYWKAQKNRLLAEGK